ncbi:MAG: mechanosensitive ion channel family protein, partial [Pseudomonadales bacterium]|nr:mechanosensitive ion channel family protein [Pseudomonadales bacterium]
RVAVGGEDAAAFAGESLRELELRLAPMRLDELEQRSRSALDYLERVSRQFTDTLIELRRYDGDEQPDPELLERARQLEAFKQDLVRRTNLLLAAAEAKGADRAESRRYVGVVAALEVPGRETTDADAPSTAQLAQRAIAQVREEPPVHERDAPWDVPLNELQLEIKPLQEAGLDERIQAWMNLLQREVRERVRIDIALQKTEGLDERAMLAELANTQQGRIQAIVQRAQVLIKELAARGGETRPYEQYIANATGQSIDVTDPTILYAQVRAWLLSPEGGVSLALALAKFVAILFAFWLLGRLLGTLTTTALQRMRSPSALLRDFLVGGIRRLVMLIGLLVGISALGIDITPLAAAIGAAGLVVGLALQGTLSNFASGILILIYRPFDVGDVIDAGGVFGKVAALNLVSTRILTFDNQVNMVPNNSIWNNVITNATAMPTRRVDLTFGIAYSDDMASAQQIIEDAVAAHEKVLEEPAPTIKVHSLGDNSVNFIVRPWVRTPDYWDVYWDLTRTIKERFDAEGINIPFPQRDLHLSGPIEVVMSKG